MANKINIKPIVVMLERIRNGDYYISDYQLFDKKGRKLGWIGKNGYLSHNCSVNGENKKLYAHRLIFAYYNGVDELLKYESINHIDGNKLNNNISNLEGMTLAENSKHQWEIGLTLSGSDCALAILDEYKVSQIKKMLYLGYSQYLIASHYNVHRSTILNIQLGFNWKNVELNMDVDIPNIPMRAERTYSNQVLYEKDIKYIRECIVNGIYTRKELAKIYGVSYSAIKKYTAGLKVNKNSLVKEVM